MQAAGTPYEGRQPYIFISYRHQDSEQVVSILNAIQKCGYRFWYDKNIEAGERWTEELANSIAGCAVFVPLLSDSYEKSEYCMKEIRLASSEKRKIVPVWLTDKHSLSPELKMLLDNAQDISFASSVSPDNFAAWMEKQSVFQPCRDIPQDGGAQKSESTFSLAECVTQCPVEPSRYFVGREEKIAEIEKAFQGGNNIVNLYGMGGLGKSEICRKLFHTYARGEGSGLVKYVGWVTWQGTLENTFYAQLLDSQDVQEDNADRYWQLAQDYMNHKRQDLLIFLDNADSMIEAQAAELTRLGCRFLVTSRPKQARFCSISAGTLTQEQCRILYRRALYEDDTIRDDSPDTVLDEMLRLAGYHTLAVELLAKTQYSAGMDTKELLEELKKSGFNLEGIEEEIVYVHRPEQGEDNDAERRLSEHMSRIFDLSQLRESKEGADALRTLQGMSLLAPNVDIPLDMVKRWMNLPNLNGLNRAVKTGWLNERTEKGGTRFISIHPVIADVVWHTAQPDLEFVDSVVQQLWPDMIVDTTEVFVTKLPVLEHAKALYRKTHSMDLQTKSYAGMFNQIGYLTMLQGDYVSALKWDFMALKIRESVLGKNHFATATTCNNIALVYDALGDYVRALEWNFKALKIRESVFGKEHPETATSYHNIANVYCHQEEYSKALEWHKKALWIYKGLFGENYPETATSYHNIAFIYYEQEDYDSALEWNFKALKIQKIVLGEGHPDTATTYNNIASVYNALKDYANALKFYEKALYISESILGKGHPNTAIIYNNIAFIYYEQGNYSRAFEWYNKALHISENVLGKGHHKTGTIYHAIGMLYFTQGNFKEAVTWMEKAFVTFIKVWGEDHPNTKTVQKYIEIARMLAESKQ